MNESTTALKQTLDTAIQRVYSEVGWRTPRKIADPIVWEAVQASHAFHRAATPAYRERCQREGIGETIRPDQMPRVAFPEEIWKGYSEIRLSGGKKMGVFCEQNVPRLIEYLNQYLSAPLTMQGLQENYMSGTNLRGGLDRLRTDLMAAQDIQIVTSSGTTGSAISLIPTDLVSRQKRMRMMCDFFDELSNLPGFSPILPSRDNMIGYSPEDGSMYMAIGIKDYGMQYGERFVSTIPSHAFTRELRWRAGVYAGLTGPLVKTMISLLMLVAGKSTAKKGADNTIAALQQAAATGKRTLFFANPWMGYNTFRRMEAMLEEEIRLGHKKPGDPYIRLAPGSVMLNGGGNKSGLAVDQEEILALIRKVIGGFDRIVEAYAKTETMYLTIRCEHGNFHLDPRVFFFKVDDYLAAFDPLDAYKVPAQVGGDFVDDLCYQPCPCGMPTGYFTKVRRDDANRGSKGCAAALQEYAY